MRIFTWQMAEELAQGHMQALGFTDARRAPNGPDGGVDVVAATAAAQVKHLSVPVGAPLVQQLRGAAHRLEHAIFYSKSGYTAAAVRFAREHRVALFAYDDAGDVTAMNAIAVGLEAGAAPTDWAAVAAMKDDQARRELSEPAQRARIFAELTAINAEVMPLVEATNVLSKRRMEEALAAAATPGNDSGPRASDAYLPTMAGVRLMQEHAALWAEAKEATVTRLWELLVTSRRVLADMAAAAELPSPLPDIAAILTSDDPE
ncbi:restriction endonuclease [Frigoribacterium sp. SL97]|uniref:restriction endonuclease n=1 Tax=Frigoribacterium sp. SL97 TaxID=2994664 RepID=UPI002271E97B|nr:restriction endonuclease [Frigoribacterium sp. SL97]WAC50470.1 restriction endonuclease [Frigoribacterium sp. SL97]